MKKFFSVLCACLITAGCLYGCGPAKTDPAQTPTEAATAETPTQAQNPTEANEKKTRIVTDWNGRQVEVPEKVETILCVNVSTLRYTTYLQAADKIVGVEEHEIGAKCTRPFSYVSQKLYEGLPLTGNNGETYDEQIIAADPDVIVAFYDAEKADALQNKVGIPVVTIPHLEGIMDEEVFFTLEFLGDLYGKQERAKELADYLHGIEEDIAKRTAKVEKQPTVYVAGVAFRGAHGFEGTEAGYGPLAVLGAVNIADAYGKGLPFDMDVEEVLRADPDYIFICNENLVNEQYAKNPDFYESFSAVQKGNVYSQISYRNCATNTEMALANMYYMGKVLYPEEFADVDPIAKTNEIVEMFLGVSDYYSVLEEAGYRFEQVTLGNEQ